MKLPNFNRLVQLKSKIISFIINHKILILVSVISISLVVFGVWAMKVRGNLLASMKSAQKDSSNGVYYSVTPAPNSNFNNLPSFDNSVLGASDEASPKAVGNDTFSIPISYPIITQIPLPTAIPEQFTAVTNTSTPSCAGTPTVDNSQVYVSPSTTQVNNTSTISVELSDCNNTIAPVSDSLTITLVSGDAGTKINGASAPVTLATQNGKVSFSATSYNATTATFLITDTTRSFSVTTPGYHNPSITFTNNSSGNANCTTAAGVPNSWFSDVYPVSDPTITAVVGSTVTFTVEIRDCFKSETSITDTLSISLSSGDPSTKVNGNNFPFSIATQNGHASFTITSSNAGNNTFIVQDTTSSFTVTDTNNHNPSAIFNGSSTVTPTDVPTSAPTDTPAPTPTDTPTLTPTPSISITP